MDKGNTTGKRALETIKLIGDQVVEMRSIIAKQNDAIKTLKNELLKLRALNQDTMGNLKMLHIDQKDLAKTVKSVKTTLDKYSNKVDNLEAVSQSTNSRSQGQMVHPTSYETTEINNFDSDDLRNIDSLLGLNEQEISKKFYSNYDNSKVIQKHNNTRDEEAKAARQARQEELSNEDSQDLYFDRIPRMLNFD